MSRKLPQSDKDLISRKEVLNLIDEIDPNLVAYKRLKEEIEKLNYPNKKVAKYKITPEMVEKAFPNTNTQNLGCGTPYTKADVCGEDGFICQECQGKVQC